jgi:crossover junction endodeoxyribonuclease RuvC
VLGYAVVDATVAGQVRYVECGVVTARAEDAAERRLGEIARGLGEIIAELAPEIVAVEDVFAKVNLRSAIALAQARGMVLAVAGMAGLRVFSYPPAQVKVAVTGRGRAPKAQVALMVKALVGLKKVPRADAADALAVAVAHAHMRKDLRRIA